MNGDQLRDSGETIFSTLSTGPGLGLVITASVFNIVATSKGNELS